MPEWWRYSPADLVYVSPAAWARLFERYHAALWPAQALALLAGLALLALALRGRGWRVALVLAALAWALVGALFHARWHTELHWAAPALAVACGVQAALLATAALAVPRGGWAAPGMARRLGLGAIALAVLAGPLTPRHEVFGLTPDATTLATLGLLLTLRLGLPALALWPLPLAAAALAAMLALP